jgi:hypothetical protein
MALETFRLGCVGSQACLEQIRDGETYEVCLTNQLTATCDLDPVLLYKTLRSVNPAPYAAWLHFAPPAAAAACVGAVCGSMGSCADRSLPAAAAASAAHPDSLVVRP